MKKFVFVFVFVGGSLLFGADYSQMSIDEMSQMRGKVAAEERADFQKAYQDKLQQLSADERSKYIGRPDSVAQGTGQNANPQGIGSQQRLKDGSGAGSGGSARGGGRGGR